MKTEILEGSLHFVDIDGVKTDFDKATWDGTLGSFFRDQRPLVAHQIDSYNQALESMIPSIIHSPENCPIKICGDFNPDSGQHNMEYQLTFNQVFIGRPVTQENNGVIRPLTPNEARIRNNTYAANLYVDIEHQLRYRSESGEWGEWEKQELPRVLICRIPLMLGSKFCMLADNGTQTRAELGECKYDNFGYFIINGQEKVLVSVEKIYDNKVLVFESSENKFSDVCEVRSAEDGRYQIAYTTKVRLYKSVTNGFGRTVRVYFHNLKADVPLFIMFRALGIESDKRIALMVAYDLADHDAVELLKPSLEEGLQALSQTRALEWISRVLNITNINNNATDEEKAEYRLNMVHKWLQKFFLPHVGDDLTRKAFYLGYMVNRLFAAVLGRRNYDDRDHFGNKKIDTPGALIAFLFAQNFQKKLVKGFEKEIRKDLLNYHDGIQNLKIDKFIKPTVLDTGIKYSFATGVWGLKSSVGTNRVGIAQQLGRINNKSALSYMRRIMSSIDKTGKSVVGPRKLHTTHWGVICPSETPDGEQIGISKNLALTAYITNHSDPAPVFETLENIGVIRLEQVSLMDMADSTKVFVNGEWIGCHKHPDQVVERLRHERRNGMQHIHTAIVWNISYREINIYTDGGRLVRPLYIVKNDNLAVTSRQFDALAKGKLKWQNLLGVGEVTTLQGGLEDAQKSRKQADSSKTSLDEAVIEYLDVNEAETAMIAMTPEDISQNSEKNPVYLDYTHCEIHPSVIFGVIISEVPFPSHNQSPRVIYYGQMGKQAIGVYATNYRQRMDTVAHVLHYPQRPLVTTRTAELIGKELPTGQNAIVAIACYSGYNQEDSVIVNAGALDRGLFTTTAFKTTKEEERKNQTELQDEKFQKPSENTVLQSSNYDAIGDDGLPILGKVVREGDVIIGKVIPLKSTADGVAKYRDASHKVAVGDGGIVDAVKWNINGDGFKFCKVKIRKTRVPQIGDKVQSRHAQKGIIGMVFPQEDMPVNKDGIVPDIIINPHAMPSRMTVGQFLEGIMGKVCCMKGFEGDATPFNGVNVQDICKLLGTPIEDGGCGFSEVKDEDGDWNGYGNEVLYNGMTGEQLQCKIFMGPTYYNRSKHMVADKFHSRATGPTQLLTRQPPEGRARHGSSRLGEMERDCLIAHGAASLLKEKFYDSSDAFTCNVNRDTGLFAIGDPNNLTLRDDMTNVKQIRCPYSFKLLHQELNSIGIAPRLVLG